MLVYAGIDEAGYGPLLGPMVVACSILWVDDPHAHAEAHAGRGVDLWDRLSGVITRDLVGRKGRIAVNDSKKLHTPKNGPAHLERGVLAFLQLAGHRPADLEQFLLNTRAFPQSDRLLPWYEATESSPWQAMPAAGTPGEAAVAGGMLTAAASKAGVGCHGFGVELFFEDRFNHLATQTRSKAAVSFSAVSRHLLRIWNAHGTSHPVVAVDRQSGRSHYREPLALAFPGARLSILDETDTVSSYRIEDGDRSMRVSFEVECEQRHMPTALASMAAKLTREMLMDRFNRYFTSRCPEIAPTAGYATDGKRFLEEISPRLPGLGISARDLRRVC